MEIQEILALVPEEQREEAKATLDGLKAPAPPPDPAPGNAAFAAMRAKNSELSAELERLRAQSQSSPAAGNGDAAKALQDQLAHLTEQHTAATAAQTALQAELEAARPIVGQWRRSQLRQQVSAAVQADTRALVSPAVVDRIITETGAQIGEDGKLSDDAALKSWAEENAKNPEYFTVQSHRPSGPPNVAHGSASGHLRQQIENLRRMGPEGAARAAMLDEQFKHRR